MKELKFMAFVFLTMGLCAFTSCSDDDYSPDAIYWEALNVKYPNARVEEWDRKGTYRVADCYYENKDLDVWFDQAAKWVMTETELWKSDLPEAVINALNGSKYSAWRVDDVDMLEYALNAKILYIIEVEQGKTEIDLYFSPDGALVNEKDVSRGDDTHWPE
jgi:Protein of unknown function (DUF2874).